MQRYQHNHKNRQQQKRVGLMNQLNKRIYYICEVVKSTELDNNTKVEVKILNVDNNKIIGYISSSFDDVTIEILNLCVDKEYQHKGIGTKLISHLSFSIFHILNF